MGRIYDLEQRVNRLAALLPGIHDCRDCGEPYAVKVSARTLRALTALTERIDKLEQRLADHAVPKCELCGQRIPEPGNDSLKAQLERETQRADAASFRVEQLEKERAGR